MFVSWANATNIYAHSLTNYQGQIEAGNTNATAPADPGPYVAREPDPVPSWLYKRGVR